MKIPKGAILNPKWVDAEPNSVIFFWTRDALKTINKPRKKHRTGIFKSIFIGGDQKRSKLDEVKLQLVAWKVYNPAKLIRL
jgi:hypothetical protein